MSATPEPIGFGDMTVAAARRTLSAALRAKGFDTPDLDARILLGHVLGFDHAALVGATDRVLDGETALRLKTATLRRLRGEPIALIVGEKEFWGLRFAVTSATLIPRPETETLVETALRVVDGMKAHARPLRILDLGTGSGAILLALLSALPGAMGFGVDRSLPALRVAHANAEALGLSDRAAFVASDFAAAISCEFNLVVSNPPYVVSSTIEHLARGVRDYEPRNALDGGSDGLDAYRAIAADSRRLLAPGGHLIVEIGQGQESDVRSLFEEAGLVWRETAPDLAGIARAVAFSVS